MTVKEIRPQAARVKRVRKILGTVIGRHMADLGDELAGFALVTWDMRGGAMSAYCTSAGPVSDSLMPSFTHDALQRHVTVAIAQRSASSEIGGEDDPA